MRIILNILAVIGGLYCGFLAIASGYLCVTAVQGCFDGDDRWQGVPMVIPAFLAIFAAGFTVLVALLVGRAFRHLRRPDRNTANNVLGITTFMVAACVLDYLRPTKFVTQFGGQAEPFIELGVFFAVIIAFYLFYRLGLKPLAARTFPSPVVESHA